jgi:hypothetical protein
MGKIVDFFNRVLTNNTTKTLLIASLNTTKKIVVMMVIIILIKFYTKQNIVDIFKHIITMNKRDSLKNCHDDNDSHNNHSHSHSDCEEDNGKYQIQKNYSNNHKKTKFKLNVSSNTLVLPIFHLRTFKEINYYLNFIPNELTLKELNNLIMLKDVHKWMSSSSLSDEDLKDGTIHLYYIKKKKHKDVKVHEFLKIFVSKNSNNIKTAFVQKGCDYKCIEKDILELINKNIIKDLLNTKDFYEYNLSLYDDVYNFLERFLSHLLIPDQYLGQSIHLNLNYNTENYNTCDYYYNTLNAESDVFNTTR